MVITTLPSFYFFNGTMHSIKVHGEVVNARYGSRAWIFEYVKRLRRADFQEGIYVLKDEKIFTFNTSDMVNDYSFNGTHVLIEVEDHTYALYLWNLTSSELLNTTQGFSIYGWNGTWYLGDRYYSQNPQLYRLEGNNLTIVSSDYVYVKGYRNTTPKLVVGNKIVHLKGLAETKVRVDHYLDSMDYWYYLRESASFDDAVAYIQYNGKERKLIIVESGRRQVFPLGEYFGGFSIIPSEKELFIYSYWNDGSSRLYTYREGKLKELTDEVESLSEGVKLEGSKVMAVFPWSKGLFLNVNPLWEGKLLYYYDWTNFTLIGLNFKPLGQIGRFYVLNSQGGISYFHNGSCMWKADTLHGEYTGGIFIARNETATEIYNITEGGLRRLLRLEIPLKFLYRSGGYLVFQQEGTDILAIFNGTSFIRLPIEGHVLGLPDGRVAIWQHGNLYLWDFRNLKKIGEFSKNLIPIDYRRGIILGESAASGVFKSLYLYNNSLNMLFPPENNTLYYYLNGTVVEQKCWFFLFKRCNYTVFDLSKHELGEFKGKGYFGYSFWNGDLYFTNGTHLIDFGNSKSIKLPFEIDDASMVSSKRGLVIFGGNKLLLYNGTFRDLSEKFLNAYMNQPYYPSTPLKLCKKLPFKVKELSKNTTHYSPPQPSSSISPQTNTTARRPIGGLALAVLIFGIALLVIGIVRYR